MSFRENSTKSDKDSDTRENEASQVSESNQDESATVSLDKLKETFLSGTCYVIFNFTSINNKPTLSPFIFLL